LFHGNKNVAFADVSLSSDQVRTINGEDMGAGAGGWPTIRYFNKETGKGGAPYVKKTEDAMCTELGNEEYMNGYIMEAGGIALCALDGEGCSDKEKKFIEKMKTKPAADVTAQLERLGKMTGEKMEAELMKWIKQRIAILKQFGETKDEL
jgi:hypothetical protein